MENNIKKIGEYAMEIIMDYPLYASTSGITYEEAIQIAKIFEPDLEKKVKMLHKNS
jgi:deoxyhypusine synthase